MRRYRAAATMPVYAKPRRFQIVSQAPRPVVDETLGADYILRACELVRAGLIPVVLVDRGSYYLADNPADLWGSKRFITHADLRQLIERAERTKAA